MATKELPMNGSNPYRKLDKAGAGGATVLLGLLLTVATTLAAQTNARRSLYIEADSLHQLGDSLTNQRKYVEAIEMFDLEIAIRRQLADTAGLCAVLNKNSRAHWRNRNDSTAVELAIIALELSLDVFGDQDTLVAYSYYNLGAIHAHLRQYDTAMVLNQKALEIRIKAYGTNHPDVATIYNNMGIIHRSLGSYQEALENYQQALDIRTKVLGSDHIDVATSYNNIGIVYRNLGQYKKALENYRKALEIRLETLGSRHLDVATTYNSIGNAYANLGQYEKALDNYLESLDIRLDLLGHHHPHVASSYNNLGIVYNNLGNYILAEKHHQEALEIWIAVEGERHPSAARSFGNLGEVYENTGAYHKALDNYHLALSIQEASLGSGHPDVARTYNRIGSVYYELREYQLALENIGKALDIWMEALGPDHPYVSSSYNNLGVIYSDLGSNQLALENHLKALDIRLATLGETHPDVATTYNNIGAVYEHQGNYSKALSNHQAALEIRTKVLGQSHPDVATSYNNLAIVYEKMGSNQTALFNHQKALTIWLACLGKNHPDVALSYSNIGNLYAHFGSFEQALDNHLTALDIRLEVLGSAHPDVGENFYNLGETYRRMGNNDSAYVYLKKSIDIFEQSRGKIRSVELKGTYSKKVTERYETIIAVLLDMKRVQEAFEYLERSKSKALKDALEETYGIDLGKGDLSQMLKASQQLAAQLETMESDLYREQSKPDSLRNQSKVKNLSKLLAQTKAEYFKVVAQIQVDPDYSFAVTVDPIQIGSVKQDIPPGQKLVMCYAGKEELYLFCVWNQGYQIRSVPVTRDSLEALIVECRKRSFDDIMGLHRQQQLLGWSWANDSSDFYIREVEPLKVILSQLYTYLIAPLEDQLSDAQVITFIPSNKLYYVPWGALIDPASTDSANPIFLSQRYNWNVLTSAELLRCVQRREAAETVNDSRSMVLVGNPAGAYLPYAETEVSAIVQFYPKSTTLIGAQATEQEVTSITPRNHALHLATHCILDAESPWDSYIQLAPTAHSDGKWTAAEISGQSWSSMQLVTLSACQTALGGSKPGLEFESMAKAFSLAMEGPPAIVATLWPVADESTKEFMVIFYNELKTSAKSEALRRAQTDLIESGTYSHPFFWAPFVLIGEWR